MLSSSILICLIMLTSQSRTFMVNKSNKSVLQLTSNSVKLRLEYSSVQMSLSVALISLRLIGSFNLTPQMIQKITSTESVVLPEVPMVRAVLSCSYLSMNLAFYAISSNQRSSQTNMNSQKAN